VVTKPRFSEKRTERFSAAGKTPATEKTLPPEVREAHVRPCRETRLSELRREYLNGTYYVPAGEISAAVIEKHLKR
jgi:hypothetical protein